MRYRRLFLILSVGWFAMIAGAADLSQAQEFAEPARPPDEAGAETLLQGPIHEAFAKPLGGETDTAENLMAPQEPPAPIEEIPPEVKPAGENVIWIPGYWAWDELQQDFLWVSGVWRVPPPNSQWVPGYWVTVDAAYRWIPGFWTSVEAQQVEYLPYPPESLENGPTSPRPSENYFWTPGCWIYQDTDYAWRPGYWTPYSEGWVWVPAHYVWTPIGAVFCNGYWDYPIARRGQVFAPVYFHNHAHVRHIRYSPHVVINVSHLLIHLFVNPGHRHYYYGDYYGPRYQTIGYTAWSDYYSRPRAYDPLFTYYSTYYQSRGVDYAQRLQGWHNYYRTHEEYRPARTWEQQVRQATRLEGNASARYSLLGRTINQVMDDRDLRNRFERVNDEQRRSLARASSDARALIRERLQAEAHTASDARARGEAGRSRGRWQLPETTAFRAPSPRADGRTPRDRAAQAPPGGAPEERRAYRPGIELNERGRPQVPGARPDTAKPDPRGRERDSIPGMRPKTAPPERPGREPGAIPGARPDPRREGDRQVPRGLDRDDIQRPTPKADDIDRARPRLPLPSPLEQRPSSRPDARRGGEQPHLPSDMRGRQDRPELPKARSGDTPRTLPPGLRGGNRPNQPQSRALPGLERPGNERAQRPSEMRSPITPGKEERGYRPPQLNPERGRGAAPREIAPGRQSGAERDGARGPSFRSPPPAARGLEGRIDPRSSGREPRRVEQPRPRPEAASPRNVPGLGSSRSPGRSSAERPDRGRPPQSKSRERGSDKD